jgi:8-oxo-dGTP pyrophosphatase MutT (NUDIX family)
VLIRNGEGNYLLILSHDRGWEIPGGAVEEGEDLLTALHREVDEEVGVELPTKSWPGSIQTISHPPIFFFGSWQT